MKTDNQNLHQEVVFSYILDSLSTDIHAESSYIASSLYSVAQEKASITPLIITRDETDFMRMSLAQAHNLIASRLAAYTTTSTQVQDDCYTFELLLPLGRQAAVDALIAHELQRALVNYTLARWYEYRVPECSARLMLSYEAALSSAVHDIVMARRGCKRPTHYL